MFCPNCGNKLADNAKFCTKCGTKMSRPQSHAAQPEPAQQANPQPQPAQGRPNFQQPQQQQPMQGGQYAPQQQPQPRPQPQQAQGQPNFQPQQQPMNQMVAAPVVGQQQGQQAAAQMRTKVKDDRGLGMYILLTLVTCGIYNLWFIHSIAEDMNTVCKDNENTPGLGMYILLSIVTCGIYNLIWLYKIGNRQANNAPYYNMHFDKNGTSILLWWIFGSLIIVGPFIAMNTIIQNMNTLARCYNIQNNLA